MHSHTARQYSDSIQGQSVKNTANVGLNHVKGRHIFEKSTDKEANTLSDPPVYKDFHIAPQRKPVSVEVTKQLLSKNVCENNPVLTKNRFQLLTDTNEYLSELDSWSIPHST